jgi:7,8-dihydropterin-6-yl-methyl-4-(beta-D-ribofuranosyl)aminobenzene 5'-phosphate synthase
MLTKTGGMLKAISMIKEAKRAKETSPKELVADLHPARPDYRGIQLLEMSISLEADPSFEEIKNAGATVSTNVEAHTVLDNMFLISGEIPRLTSYENGVKHGIRYNASEETWVKDELIMDERFLMCNVKGKAPLFYNTFEAHPSKIKASLSSPAAVMLVSLILPGTPWNWPGIKLRCMRY